MQLPRPLVLDPWPLGALAAEFEERATQLYREAEESDFSGDSVETHDYPASLGRDWVPLKLWEGLKPDWNRAVMLSTADAEVHTDFHGPTMLLVLANQGLKFKYRGTPYLVKAGDRLVFDDRHPHAAVSSRRSRVLLLASVPLV